MSRFNNINQSVLSAVSREKILVTEIDNVTQNCREKERMITTLIEEIDTLRRNNIALSEREQSNSQRNEQLFNRVLNVMNTEEGEQHGSRNNQL
jgi:hypothetical protein